MFNVVINTLSNYDTSQKYICERKISRYLDIRDRLGKAQSELPWPSHKYDVGDFVNAGSGNVFLPDDT